MIKKKSLWATMIWTGSKRENLEKLGIYPPWEKELPSQRLGLIGNGDQNGK